MARSTTEQAVGAAVKALRMRQGLSMAQLGAKVGRSRQYVQRLESGEMAPPISVYAVFAKALGVTLADLLPVGDPSQPSE